MVKVEVRQNDIKVTGHAMGERNDQDHDLICCAVSTLVQALECGINPRFLEVMKKESGDLHYKIYPPTEAGIALVVMANIKMVVNSLGQLQRENPGHIELIIE